jgi:TPR repeat protein
MLHRPADIHDRLLRLQIKRHLINHYGMAFTKILSICLVLSSAHIAAYAQSGPNDYLYNLKEKAEKGDPVSQLALSECYGVGKMGAELDFAKAIYWTERAANGSDYEIQKKAGFKLAFLFSFGVGELERPKDALFWSEKALRQGDTKAFMLCSLNHKRLGNIKMAYQYALAEARWSMNKEKVFKVEQDYEKLLTAKEREAYAKEAEALDPLKMMNAEANDVLLKSLTLIASMGDHDSEYELAMHHLNGGMGLTPSQEKGVFWLKRAAAGGNQKAKDKLAQISVK